MALRILFVCCLGIHLNALAAGVEEKMTPTNSQSTQQNMYQSQEYKFTLEELFSGPDVIWGFDFLSPDEILFSERSGKVKILKLSNKKVIEVTGVPTVWAQGQGGLLDIRVHPLDRKQVYMVYSEPTGDDQGTTSLATATLENGQLKNLKKIFSAHPSSNEKIHFGSRIEFVDNKYLFLTVGERNERPKVQDLSTHLGKIIRLNLDGTTPNDNPFANRKDAKPEIWSYGHRSPQGLVWDADNKQLWMSEMGPLGGDEINRIKPGANYGWPLTTYGREYYGMPIGTKQKPGIEEPTAYWVPSISPSGITIYTGDVFKKWRGNLFVGTLSGQHLRRLVIKNGKVTQQEELLCQPGYRVRNVRTGPEGFLYLSNDDGRIVRLAM